MKKPERIAPGSDASIEDTRGAVSGEVPERSRQPYQAVDRGIPTESVLQEMRAPERQTFYLVGTPKARIQQQEKKWLDLPCEKVRDSVEVKFDQHEGELYVLAKSQGRQAKETAMRRTRLAWLLRKLRAMRRS